MMRSFSCFTSFSTNSSSSSPYHINAISSFRNGKSFEGKKGCSSLPFTFIVRTQRLNSTNFLRQCSSQPPVVVVQSEKPTQEEKAILLSTRDNVGGFRVKEELGLVSGSAVKCRAITYDLIVRVKSLLGGEMKSYGELLSATSAEATRRLLLEAKHVNADAVVKVRYQISSTADPTSGVFIYSTAYGTAVLLEKEDGEPRN